jgi:hypothetical protein
MERKEVKRVLNNHKIIPFVEEILDREDVSLSISELDNKYVVYSGDFALAKRKSDYIEFNKESDAKDFVSSIPDAFKDIPLEEMDQKEFEEARTTVKWKYEGTMIQVEE